MSYHYVVSQFNDTVDYRLKLVISHESQAMYLSVCIRVQNWNGNLPSIFTVDDSFQNGHVG